MFRWVWWLVAGAAVVLLIAGIIRVLTPAPVTIPKSDFQSTNLNNTTTTFANIRFQGTIPEFPTSLSIARAIRTQQTLTELINELALRFKMEPIPELTNGWASENYSLTIDPQDQSTILTQNEVLESDRIVDFDQALSVATETTSSLFPQIPLQPLKEQVIYSRGDVHMLEVVPAQASEVLIPFAPLIDDLPVYYRNFTSWPFMVTINSQDELVRLEFYPLFFTFETIGQRNLISVERAIENINRNQGAIISGYQTDLTPLNWQAVTRGTFDTVSVEYRIDNESSLAYPFYRFSGQLINDEGQTIEAEVITPAVAVN